MYNCTWWDHPLQNTNWIDIFLFIRYFNKIDFAQFRNFFHSEISKKQTLKKNAP